MFDANTMFQNARESGTRITFIEAGKHMLVFAHLEDYSKLNEAPKYEADFVVAQSGSPEHQPGDLVSVIFHPYGTKFQGQGAKEAGNIQKLMKALHGLPSNAPPEDLARVFNATLDKSQPMRGTIIKCDAWTRVTQNNATISEQNWENVPGQTPDSVAANRAKVDANPIIGMKDNKASQPPQQQYQQPPQQQYQQQQYQQPPQQQQFQQPPMAQQPPPPPQQEFQQQPPPQAPPQAAPQQGMPPGVPQTPPGGNGGFNW